MTVIQFGVRSTERNSPVVNYVLLGLVVALPLSIAAAVWWHPFFWVATFVSVSCLCGAAAALYENAQEARRQPVPHTRDFSHPENDNFPIRTSWREKWSTFLFIVGLAAFNKKEDGSLYD